MKTVLACTIGILLFASMIVVTSGFVESPESHPLKTVHSTGVVKKGVPQKKVQVQPTIALPAGITLVQEAHLDAIAAGIDPNIFVRQINQESGFQTLVVSHAGAIGIAQFIPSTAAGLGINPWEPHQSLRAAAYLDARNLAIYHNYAKVMACYNAGCGWVTYCVNHPAPDWFSCLPGETKNYINVILG